MVYHRERKKYDTKLLKDDFNMFVVDWHNEDVPDEEMSNDSNNSCPDEFTDKFTIKAFGLDSEGSSIALDITGFKPYFFIKVPDNWNNSIAGLFIENLRTKVYKKFRNTLCDWRLLKAKPFYYFTGDERYRFNYIKLMFDSYNGYKKFGWILREKIKIPGINKSKPYLYDLYESNILPTLRFIHEKDLSATGWIQLPKGRYVQEYNETTCQLQLSCHYKHIRKHESEDIPPINYVSYDIEADSSHGDFPIAEKDYQKLARDIITEYNRLHDEQKRIKRARETPRREFNIRGILARLIELAFNPYYNNNNIRSVMTIGNEKPSPALIEELAPVIRDIIEDSDPEEREDQLLELFETNFPKINLDDEMDYYQLADQFVKEITRLKRSNNVIYQEHPLEVIKLLIELAFDEYYDNNNCNGVFLTNLKKRPVKQRINTIIPTINDVCERCYKFIVKERKTGRKKLKPGEKKVTQDDFVEKLSKIFNSYFAKLEGDKIIQIGSVFKRYGDDHPYLKHIITLNSCSEITNKVMIDHENKDINIPEKDLLKELLKNYPDRFEEGELKKALKDPDKYRELNELALEHRKKVQYENDKSEVIVEQYDTEAEVITAWVDLIRKTDPDLVIGYNIFGFDYKYMYGRAKALGIESELSKIGRIDWFQGRGGTRDETVLKEQKLSSSGLGDNTLYYLYMFGRVSIDLYKLAQKSFNLESYKLDFVCKKYLHKSKNDLPPSQIFIKQKGSADDRREIAEYCLIDCILVTRFLDKLDIIINNIGMSHVCSVPFSFLFLRGQGIKLLSFVAKICRSKGYLIPVLKRDDDGDDDESYEGAIVLTAVTGIYLDSVIVVPDFNSLYPSCIISENLSHDSYVSWKIVPKGSSTDFKGKLLNPENQFEQMLLDGKFKGWYYVDVIFDLYEYVPVAPGRKKQKKIVKAHKVCRYAQPPNGEKSIIPNILKELLTARKATRATQKNYPKGSFKWNVLEGLQLAYKVTANSLYGQIGARTSAIFLMDIAACTTATGRNLIIFSKKFCEKNYKKTRVVYGDTDSLFVKFHTEDRYGNKLVGLDAINKSIELCIESAGAISKQLKPPHNLEFEKAIWPFILVSKKRYHGHYYTTYGSPSYYANSMGIVLKRRDNAKIVKHVFGGMTDIIMKEHSVEKAIQFIKRECKKMLDGLFSMDYFIITKTLRSYYKTPDQIAHNVLAQRIGKRDPGNKPQGNDRIPYAYIRVKDQDCLQGDRIETPEFIKDHDLKLDYRFYLIRQIIKPVSQILELVISNADVVFKNIITDYDNALIGAQKLTKSKFANIVKIGKIKSITGKELLLEYKKEGEEEIDGEFEDDIIDEEKKDSDEESDEDDELDSDDEKIR